MAGDKNRNIPLLLLLFLIFGYKKAAETFYASTTLTVSDNFFCPMMVNHSILLLFIIFLKKSPFCKLILCFFVRYFQKGLRENCSLTRRFVKSCIWQAKYLPRYCVAAKFSLNFVAQPPIF